MTIFQDLLDKKCSFCLVLPIPFLCTHSVLYWEQDQPCQGAQKVEGCEDVVVVIVQLLAITLLTVDMCHEQLL